MSAGLRSLEIAALLGLLLALKHLLMPVMARVSAKSLKVFWIPKERLITAVRFDMVADHCTASQADAAAHRAFVSIPDEDRQTQILPTLRAVPFAPGLLRCTILRPAEALSFRLDKWCQYGD